MLNSIYLIFQRLVNSVLKLLEISKLLWVSKRQFLVLECSPCALTTCDFSLFKGQKDLATTTTKIRAVFSVSV